MRSAILIMLAFLLAGCSNSLTPDVDFSTTSIRYSLPEDAHVKVWLENSYSTKVKTLVDEFQQQGHYSIQLEMVDEDKTPLPSGLYTYNIETEKLSASRAFVYPGQQNQGR